VQWWGLESCYILLLLMMICSLSVCIACETCAFATGKESCTTCLYLTMKGLTAAKQEGMWLHRVSMSRCALYLLKEDVGELLRRVSVICVEDAVLHPSLPMLVWLMAAQACPHYHTQAPCNDAEAPVCIFEGVVETRSHKILPWSAFQCLYMSASTDRGHKHPAGMVAQLHGQSPIITCMFACTSIIWLSLLVLALVLLHMLMGWRLLIDVE
jgi:hypothetical protein